MTQKNTPVAIIGAMEQEITLLQSRIAQPQHEKIAHVAITRGTLAGKPVLLAQSGIGKVNAAITTAILLEKYQAACVINTGSAGGLQGGMKQGDVVVGIQTAHHDADATAFDYVIGQLPQMPARYDSDATLVEHAARAAVAFDGAAIHRGLIVSGDQFINHPDKCSPSLRSCCRSVWCGKRAAAIQTCRTASPVGILRSSLRWSLASSSPVFRSLLRRVCCRRWWVNPRCGWRAMRRR